MLPNENSFLETTTFSDDLRRYLALLWHWAWLLIIVTLVFAGLTYYFSQRTIPVYQAATSVLINEAPATRVTDYSAIVASERLAQTYSQLITKQPVLEGVAERLGLKMPISELKRAIQVQPVRDTTLIEVRVEDIYPQRAADIANALVAEFSKRNQELQSSRYAASKQSLQSQLAQMDEQIQANNDALAALDDVPENKSERDRLEANQTQYSQTYAYLLQSFEQVRLAEAQSTSNVIQAEPAVPPIRPIRPRTLTNTALAAIVGLMLAVGGVFLIEALDDTLRSPEDVTREFGLPVLGLIASHGKDDRPITARQPRSPVAEAFRSLRTNIQFASVDQPLHSLLITSTSPEEGKSTVAANLSVTLAQSGRRVTLVDADLRRPKVHKVMGLNNQPGISSLFMQPQVVLNGALQETEIEGLTALTSGNLPPNPAELLGSEKMMEIIQNVRKCSDIVVLDSPPVLVVTDAVVLAPRVDGVILVVKPGTTKRLACKQAVEQLQRVGANILGVVLNDVDVKRSSYRYAYYKGYYYTNNKFYGNEEQSKL
jgi:non-specific protein-tyrosine kinase